MNKEQKEEVVATLVEFIERVAKGQATCGTEIAVLPQVAEVLLKITVLL